MAPIRLSDTQRREVEQAGLTVPRGLRDLYLKRVADRLRAEPELGDGLVHKVSYQVARSLIWTSDLE